MDWKQYFEDREITYHVEGEKNVSTGWTNIQCPFPHCSDHSWHLGVNLASGMFNCYVCGSKGAPTKLVQALENCSWKKAKAIVKAYGGIGTSARQKRVLNRRVRGTEIPGSVEPTLAHIEYLEGRRFDVEHLIREYHIRFTTHHPVYPWSIIVPVFYQGLAVTFTSRAVGEVEGRWRHQQQEHLPIRINDVLYNAHTVKQSAVIVEGVTDAWRIGAGAIALFSKNFTQKQIVRIRKLRLARAVVLFDADDSKQKRGLSLAEILSEFIKDVRHIELSEGDPAELGNTHLIEIRRYIEII